MGNNSSTTRRSSAGGSNPNVRKSSVSAKGGLRNLDDEFSDLILQKVHSPSSIKAPGTSGGTEYSNQFTNDLIEDEFNELNDGLIETDATEVSRNFLPSNDPDDMDIDRKEVSPPRKQRERDRTPTPDLAMVDFRRISAPQSQFSGQLDNSYMSSERLPVRKKSKILIPVEVKWVNSTKEMIHRISIIGSFSNWRDVIRLKPSTKHPNEFVTKIKLPLGVHKLLYIVNNEYRVSDQLPTATDQEGILFNWFEVIDEQHMFNHSQHQVNHIGASSDYDANIIESRTTQTAGKYDVDRINRKSNSFLTKVSKDKETFEHIEYSHDREDSAPSQDYQSYSIESSPYEHKGFFEVPQKIAEYSREIPEMYVNYDFFKNKAPNYELTEPPQLPAHLNNVLLNKMSVNEQRNHADNIPQYSEKDRRPPLRRADSSYYASNQEAYHLSVPNHVILNHLMTTSIRNDVLTVACITRYSGKFVTQIMHSPAD